jgi:membrane-bound ClpP family serine protease
VIITTVVIVSALFMLLIWLVVKAHRRKVHTGVEGIIGETGEVFKDILSDEGGLVKLRGEIWKAVSNGEQILTGSKVKVLAVHDLQITVTKT